MPKRPVAREAGHHLGASYLEPAETSTGLWTRDPGEIPAPLRAENTVRGPFAFSLSQPMFVALLHSSLDSSYAFYLLGKVPRKVLGVVIQ